jgi:hypothetical protein
VVTRADVVTDTAAHVVAWKVGHQVRQQFQHLQPQLQQQHK